MFVKPHRVFPGFYWNLSYWDDLFTFLRPKICFVIYGSIDFVARLILILPEKYNPKDSRFAQSCFF